MLERRTLAMETATTSASPLTGPHAAAGPLVVSTVNPRYFEAASTDVQRRRAVYLTGSHIWNNFHDGLGPGPACSATPERNDFGAYLELLKKHGHNFIRLWRWEQFKSQAAGGGFHLCMTPQPWPRTGPGTAKDGKPKFDLSAFDPAFFDRLRERIIAAGNAGIYVAVMFFDGWALHLSPAPDNVAGHPFHAANNVNDIGIRSIVDYQVLPLEPRVQALQEAYIKKVVDTVHDLPNVLYEVANESSGGGTLDGEMAKALNLGDSPEARDPGDSTQWQYWVIDVVKRYTREQGYDAHPMGMTMQYPVAAQQQVNAPLYASAAEWISPGYDDEIFAQGGHPMAPNSPPSRWYADPPAGDGRKVVISDTDHYAPGKGDALWAWKSFLRGHHPILMDFGIIDVVHPLDPSFGVPPFEAYTLARYAMGDTRRYAERMGLIDMVPRGDLASTGYALANVGAEYLILQPSEAAEALAVQLPAGEYAVEWFGVASRETASGDVVRVERDGRQTFRAPFGAGPAVLYLKRAGRESDASAGGTASRPRGHTEDPDLTL
jgi:hypothetical protein